jgi:phosphatidylglycerophosphatase A
MRHLKSISSILFLSFPVIASAQTVQSVLAIFLSILNQVIPILMVIATIVFLYGVIGYITAGADEEKRTDSKSYIIWGLIGLFAIVAVWGIVKVLVNTFGLGGVGIPIGPGGL